MTQTILHVPLTSRHTQTVLDGLEAEYGRRYGTARPGGARRDIDRYPAGLFVPPLGDFIVLLEDDEPIAGGAFMSHDDETVEIKRVWTHPDRRRQGLARRMMDVLEHEAGALGYTRAYLTTGFLQPEAIGLYRSIGYRPLFDVDAAPELYKSLGFEKHIGRAAGQAGRSPLRTPAGSPAEAIAEVNAIKAAQEKQILARLARHADRRLVA